MHLNSDLGGKWVAVATAEERFSSQVHNNFQISIHIRALCFCVLTVYENKSSDVWCRVHWVLSQLPLILKCAWRQELQITLCWVCVQNKNTKKWWCFNTQIRNIVFCIEAYSPKIVLDFKLCTGEMSANYCLNYYFDYKQTGNMPHMPIGIKPASQLSSVHLCSANGSC